MRLALRKLKLYAVVHFVLWGFGAGVFAQELPYLRNVAVTSSVQVNTDKEIYVYAYKIGNHGSSAGTVDRLEIDIANARNSLTLDTVGLRFARPFIKSLFERNFAKTVDRVVPVGFPSLPALWIGSITERASASFYGQSINPGETLEGFSLASKGLPGIRSFSAEPTDISDLYPTPDQVSNQDSLAKRIDEDREAVKFHGLTIGPMAPPADLVATTWIDTLLSYTRQSAELGWLAPSTGLGKKRDDDCDDERPDDGITKNIEQRLQKAKRELLKRDSVQARKELEKLVQKVERIWKRSEAEEKKQRRDRWEKRDKVIMTSEAYALLKYNTEYLIERLPGERKKKK